VQNVISIFYHSNCSGQAQRDLYIAVRDLFVRHDRLSLDQVERLKKRVETTSLKLDGIKSVQKDGWQDEAEKLIAAIEKDQTSIAAQLSRRVFIRAWCVGSTQILECKMIMWCSLWHELRVVLHNRENTLITATVQSFAREEQEYAETVINNWVSLAEGVEEMPFE